MPIVALLVALALAACSGQTRIATDITTFHTLPSVPAGKTFAVVPQNDGQASSLEWKTYARQIARHFERLGLLQANEPSRANFVVFFRYAITDGQTTTSAVPMFGQTSGGTTATTTGFIGRTPISSSTYTPPTYGVTGYDTVEQTRYGRGVRIQMVDLDRTTDPKRPEIVYEATAMSVGSIGSLPTVMPYILDGVFQDWPGVPGTTQRRTIPMRE